MPSRYMIFALCLMATTFTSGAIGADPTAKKQAALLRAYLPTLLQKGLLANERQQEKELRSILIFIEPMQTGGLVNETEAGEVERAHLHQRLRAMRQETTYRNSLDQFKHKHKHDPKDFLRVEQEALNSLVAQMESYEQVLRDVDQAMNLIAKLKAGPPDVKFRAQLRGMATKMALVQGVLFPAKVMKSWSVWEKRTKKELDDAMGKHRAFLDKARDEIVDKEVKGQPVPEKIIQQARHNSFELGIGDFEKNLRDVEANPQASTIRELLSRFHLLMLRARNARLKHARENWPELPKVRLKDIDLLTSKGEKAEGVVVKMQPNATKAIALKARLRKIRDLAAGYKIQQRLFELSYLSLQDGRDILREPPQPGRRIRARDVFPPIRAMVKARNQLGEAKSVLIQTWINFQIVRLDFYAALGAPLPRDNNNDR